MSIYTMQAVATLTEVPTTPRRLRPRTKAPDPKIPEWPKQEWPKELQDLCKEFEDVLVEELDSEQVVRCPPMDVELLPGSKPFFARRPRKNPLHWKEKVKKEVQKLIKQGVIERIPANECALWISPAGFIAKDKKEEKLRLVCDLRNLNKSIKDDCSIFPTPNEVMTSLKSSSKFFCKLDLLQGYHQIPISSKSRNLFCFALEDGLYRYCRAPMGYKGSSHYFNRIVQKIFEDITSTHIQVDDLLS